MARLVVCWFMLLVGLGVNAQYQFVKQWDKRFGGTDDDGAYSLIATYDGGYLLGGYSRSGLNGDRTEESRGEYDYWVVKIDPNGNKQWDKRFGGTAQDILIAVTQSTDSGYYLAGRSFSGPGGDKTCANKGGMDYWVVKMDVDGNILWDRCYGGILEDMLGCASKTADGGCIMGGTSVSPQGGDKTEPNWDTTNFEPDMWIVKIDAAGQKQWDKRYGGTGYDYVLSILQTEDGGYLLGGGSRSGISGDKTQPARDGYMDYWIVKVDSAGTKQWDSRYGGTSGDYGCNLLKSGRNGYFLGGTSYSGADGDKTTIARGSADYWILEIDSSRQKIWDVSFGGPNEDEASYAFFRCADGGFVVSGSSRSDIGGDKTENNTSLPQTWIVKADSLGRKMWDKTMFTTLPNTNRSILETEINCYIVFGFTVSGIGGYKSEPNRDTTNSSPDYWVIIFCMEPFSGIEQTPKSPKGDLNSRIQVWPNPFSTDVSIALTGSYTSTATFTITSITGQVVYQQQETNLAPGYTKMLDLSYLPNGVYFVEVSTAAGKAVQRVVKE